MSNKPKYFKYIGLLLVGVFTSAPIWAQDAAGGRDLHFIERIFGDIILLSALVVIAGAIATIVHLVNTMMKMQKMRLLEEHGVEVLEKAEIFQKESWFRRMYKRATNVVPIEKEADIMLEHPHDGIRELDNSLPPWWLAMFYITILFAVVYLFYYHVLDYGPSQSEEYAIEMEEAEEAVKAYLASQADQVDENTVELLQDEDQLALGKTIYDANCALCHGYLGEGGIGPNFTDQYWIHGGDIKDLFRTVKYGVPEKGMISWSNQLRPADMQRVSSYILTLVGTNPPNAKEAQGELYVPQAEATDSTGVETEPAEDASIGMNINNN